LIKGGDINRCQFLELKTILIKILVFWLIVSGGCFYFRQFLKNRKVCSQTKKLSEHKIKNPLCKTGFD
jgi:hypothetical protein